MKMTKKLLAAVLALSLAACTAVGTISASADEATDDAAVSATEMAMPNFAELTDYDVLDGDLGTIPENVIFVWLETNWDYAKSLVAGDDLDEEEKYLDFILKKTSDEESGEDMFVLECFNVRRFDSYDEFIEAYESDEEESGFYYTTISKERVQEYKEKYGDTILYLAAPVDMLDCDVTVDTSAQTVDVTYNGNEIPRSEYTVTYFGVDNDYESWEFPAEPGEYSVTVAAKDGSFYVKGENDNATFTIEAEEESSESTVESESESTVESEETSETESTADTSSAADSSKADSSSKTTSTASSTNPATGAAAAMGILAVAAAGIAVSKKKTK